MTTTSDARASASASASARRRASESLRVLRDGAYALAPIASPEDDAALALDGDAARDGDARRRDDATTRVAVPVALGASERRAFADAVAASARASRRGSSGARRATTPRATLERTESERALEALAATATST